METPAQPSGSRAYRSRTHRPCDKCRKSKQLCIITVEGGPCGGCQTRQQQCTFILPPVHRHKRSKLEDAPSDDNPPTGTGPLAGPSNYAARNPLQVEDDLETSPENLARSYGSAGWAAPLPADLPTGSYQVDEQVSRYGVGVGISDSAAAGPSSVPTVASPLELLGQANANSAWVDQEMWQALFHPQPQLQPGLDPISLDGESALGVESHFLGTGTFRGLTLREINNATQSIPNRPGMVEFRQVSADEQYPVYFVRHPSLQYGEAPENGKVAWDKVTRLCAHLGPETLLQTLSILKRTVLPALPIINYPQLEQACRTSEGSGPPYAILAAAVAHAASYISGVRPLHQQLWAHVLNAIDAEFRQPRLLAIQLVVLLLSSRPGVNFAQSDITLTRAIGAVHVLGLHIDPSQWSLPAWERSLRIRLFWTVLIHDKMRSLLLGRPSHLSSDNYSTPMPTMEDARWDNETARATLSADHTASMESYIATCRLVPIIEKLLDGFMTIKAALKPMDYLSRIALLHEIRSDLDRLDASLSPAVRLGAVPSVPPHALYATGIRSLQICILGLKIIVHRIELDIIDREYPPHVRATVYESALTTAATAVLLVSELTLSDRTMFWMPYTFHHMSNAGSLLLRIASEYRAADPAVSARATSLVIAYCHTLAKYWKEEQWDMADETLKRLAEPAFTVGKEYQEAREVYRIISNALGYQVLDSAWDDLAPTNYLGFINDGFDPSVWTIDGAPWINF